MKTFFATMDERAQRALLEDLRPRIWAYAVKRRGLADDVADDVVQEVLTIFCYGREGDTSRAWDGKADPVQTAYALAKNVIYTRRKAKTRFVEEDEDNEPPDSAMRPDKLLGLRRFVELLKVIRPELEKHLEDDALCLTMLRLFDQGFDGWGEQASQLGVGKTAIKDGWERLKRAMVRVARAHDARQIREGLQS